MNDKHELAKGLYLKGFNMRQVAKKVGVSRSTINNWLRDMNVSVRPRHKVSELIPQVVALLKQYTAKVTIRQVYYRLVSAGVIENKETAYNYLGKQIANARKRGIIPFSAFEDRSRRFLKGQYPFTDDSQESVFDNAKNEFEEAEETFEGSWTDYTLPYWYGQPKHVEVWIEKEALTGVFQDVTDRYNVWLAPCRGYPSLTYVYEASNRLRYINNQANPGKELTILYFGDYDMSGVDIERNLRETLYGFGIDVSIERVALTKQQIADYNLPPQPSKKGDPKARGWIASHGDVAWELDALDPNVLTQVVKEAVERNISKEVQEKRSKRIEEGRTQIKRMIEEYFGENQRG